MGSAGSPDRSTPLRVGLTGGIASGKSTVAELFSRHGVPVIDADRIARDLVEPGGPALERIVAEFGPEVLDRAGRLDRRAVRHRIFSDPAERRRLEGILHPMVARVMFERAAACEFPYCLLVIPLLVESGLHDRMDRVLVVDVPVEVQRERLAARDQADPAQVEAMLASQTSRRERLEHADDVIDNSGPRDALQPQVDKLHRRYLAAAADRVGDSRRPD